MRTTSKQKSGLRKGFLITGALQWRRRWWIRSSCRSSKFISHKRSRIWFEAAGEKFGEYWMAFVVFMVFWIMTTTWASPARWLPIRGIHRDGWSPPFWPPWRIAYRAEISIPRHDEDKCAALNKAHPFSAKRGLATKLRVISRIACFWTPGRGKIYRWRDLMNAWAIATCFMGPSTPTTGFEECNNALLKVVFLFDRNERWKPGSVSGRTYTAMNSD